MTASGGWKGGGIEVKKRKEKRNELTDFFSM